MNIYEQELKHYGVLGMKWGVRRYQNADGSLTDAGRKRYGVKVTDPGKAVSSFARNLQKTFANDAMYIANKVTNSKHASEINKEKAKANMKSIDEAINKKLIPNDEESKTTSKDGVTLNGPLKRLKQRKENPSKEVTNRLKRRPIKMLSSKEAADILRKYDSKLKIDSCKDYGENFLFTAFKTDHDMDPFYLVNKKTGKVDPSYTIAFDPDRYYSTKELPF